MEFHRRANGETLLTEINFNCLISSRNCYILFSGGFVVSLPAGKSVFPSSLSSPVINSHAYQWKCLRFWYFIGSDVVHDWYTASLMVNVRTVTSNQTMLLFFTEEVTDKAQYTQIPLPSNYTNAQVFTLFLVSLQGLLHVTDEWRLVIVFPTFQCPIFTETGQYHTLQFPINGFYGSLKGRKVYLICHPTFEETFRSRMT